MIYYNGRLVAAFNVVKPTFHYADTDSDILADILARIVARMSACRSACRRNNFRKSRVPDVSARILARMSVSSSWNAGFTRQCGWARVTYIFVGQLHASY